MTTRYLLAAEADKIQDFIFRASHLREVVGGSQLLTRFCEEVPERLLSQYGSDAKKNVVINSGGSFRILFNHSGDANDFGEKLSEIYRLAADGSLSVAEVVSVDEPLKENFGKANKLAEEKLRQVKRSRKGWQTTPHLPYVAFCSSCGIGLATEYRKLYPTDDKSQYLCKSCLAKREEREAVHELGPFLETFYRAVTGTDDPERFDWPGKRERGDSKEYDPVEDIADLDDRSYVAYLLADGNEMGIFFDMCRTVEQIQVLSQGLDNVICQSLAVPTKKAKELIKRESFIPLLPLIMGGDDLFALIPASWALDFANCFSREYEKQIGTLLKKPEFDEIRDEIPKPTVSVSVIICKNKYPYTLAHNEGEIRLKEAKRMCKRLAQKEDKHLSSVNFKVILGGSLPQTKNSNTSKMRPTLRPYWVGDAALGWGLSLNHLIEQRYKLRNIPNKRLSELSQLYDYPIMPSSLAKDEHGPWKSKQDYLLARIGRDEEQKRSIDGALKHLGSDGDGHWYHVQRSVDRNWYGHGLPDLLEAWDFALSLDCPKENYEVE